MFMIKLRKIGNYGKVKFSVFLFIPLEVFEDISVSILPVF